MVYEKKDRKYRSAWRALGFGRGEDEKEDLDGADTRTKIDEALLHDIVPQPGGDHEPLDETHVKTTRFLRVLTLGMYDDNGEFT